MHVAETRTFDVEAGGDARQTALLEAFLEYCRERLFSDSASPVRSLLRRENGLSERALAAGPIGLYPCGRQVRCHLLGLGFAREEIRRSTVVGDARLAGRLVVSWRDGRGRLRTIAALLSPRQTPLRLPPERTFVPNIGERRFESDARATIAGPSSHPDSDVGVLYLRGSRRPALFGLDVALRCPARDQLILVHSMLDVLYLQSVGIQNAVSPGRWPIAAGAFRSMVEQGVRAITVVLADDPAGWHRTLEVLESAARAEVHPNVAASTPGSLGFRPSAVAYVRGLGADRLRWAVYDTIGNRDEYCRAMCGTVRRRRQPERQQRRLERPVIAPAQPTARRTPQETPPERKPRTLPQPVELDEAAIVRAACVQRTVAEPVRLPPANLIVEQTEDIWGQASFLVHLRESVYNAANADSKQQESTPVPVPAIPEPAVMAFASDDAWPSDGDIQVAAYLLWQRLGRPDGRHEEIWHAARRSLLEQRPDTIPFFRPVGGSSSRSGQAMTYCITASDPRSVCGRTRAA